MRDKRATRVHRVMRKGTHTKSHYRLATRTLLLFRGSVGADPGPQPMSTHR